MCEISHTRNFTSGRRILHTLNLCLLLTQEAANNGECHRQRVKMDGIRIDRLVHGKIHRWNGIRFFFSFVCVCLVINWFVSVVCIFNLLWFLGPEVNSPILHQANWVHQSLNQCTRNDKCLTIPCDFHSHLKLISSIYFRMLAHISSLAMQRHQNWQAAQVRKWQRKRWSVSRRSESTFI